MRGSFRDWTIRRTGAIAVSEIGKREEGLPQRHREHRENQKEDAGREGKKERKKQQNL
jgi:hypothetical protein